MGSLLIKGIRFTDINLDWDDDKKQFGVSKATFGLLTENGKMLPKQDINKYTSDMNTKLTGPAQEALNGFVKEFATDIARTIGLELV